MTHFNFNESLVTVTSPNQTSETLSRDYRKGTISSPFRNLTLLFAILTMSLANIGMAWGTDFTVTVDQIRILPTRSAFIRLSGGSNCTASGGYLNIANNKTGTFTVASTIPETYKIKSITFTVSRNVSGFTCTAGGTLSGSDKSWTFTPTSSIPVGTASFSLNNTSGGGANITFVVTLTTAETVTVEELKTFSSLTAGAYSFTSSTATTQVELTDVGSDVGAASSNCIQFNKSSSKTYALKVTAKTGYNLKFVSLYYYDNSSDPTSSASTGIYTKTTYTWVPSTTTTNVILTYSKPSSEGVKIYKIYVGYESVASGCTSYSFHYGNDGAPAGEWTTECFVAQGEEHEMQIEDFTIPSATRFYVGKNSEFHGTTGNASDANSLTVTWSSMYFAHSAGDGSRPMVGQATGATGTIRIYDNSTWTNKQAAFIPDGYKLKIGSTEYPFAVYSGNEFRSDLVEMSSSNARSNISVGITNNSGGYVATDNTQEMQHLFLNTGGDALWSKDGRVNFGIYNVTSSSWACLMTKVPGEDYLYEGWVPSTCTTVIFVRLSESTLSWDKKDNQTGDLTLESGKNLLTITDWGAGTWSAYEKSGKFRINRDYRDKNWYVRFVPYHVLHYDANGGTGEPADQSVAADASPCQLTVSSTEPTRTDYVFQGWNPTKATADAGTIDGAWDPSDTHAMTGDVTLYAVWTACTGPNGNSSTWTAAGYAYDQNATANAMSLTGVIASNGGALSYQWYKTTSDIAHGEAISGATSNTYTPATDVAHAANWYYFCRVTEAGCSTTYTSDLSGAIVVNEAATLYTVTYNVNGGGSVTPASATQASTGAAVTLPTPTWSGYTFEGWYSAGTKIGGAGASYTPTADITLYAHWTDDVSGKVFSFIDNNYGDKFKGFDGDTWVTGNADGNKSKTYTHGTTGVKFVVTNGSWDKKNNAISALAKFKSGTTSMSIVIPDSKVATVKILYGAYSTDNKLTVNSTNQDGITTALADGNTNVQVYNNLKEITLTDQEGTLTLGSSKGNIYIARVSAVLTSTATITATLLTPEYMPTGSSGVQIGVEITGASTGWKYRVKNGSGGYEGPDNTAYTTTTWTMTSTIGAGANTYVVELYDGTGTKQATSNTITVTGETTYPVTITAGANGTVSPSGVVQANGSHIKPEIIATPNSGYRFVNWTLSNSNATLADASSATTTITNATGACEITANFEANPTALVHWTMNVTTDAAWGTSATSTTDGTNITSIGTSHSEGNNAAKNSATAKTAMAAEEVTTTAAPTNSANFTFTIAGGKQVEPEKVTCQVFNVSSGSRTYKAQISDTNGHVYNSTNTVAVTEEAELTDATFNFASDLVLTGTVTVKIYAWGSGSEFRMGPDVKLFGEVQTALTYTLTASATVSNQMTADSKTGAITGSFTNNPVTAITSGTTTSTSSNTFTVNKTTPVTVTAAATIDGTEAQCDECTYVFDSWENIPATVTADVSTIHAVYKTTYTISFKETDESAVAGVSGTSYVYGEGKAASTLPTPSKSGYTFDGWYKENTLTNAATDIDNDDWGNVTYYAKWTEDECTPTTLFSMVVADSGSDADVARQGGTLSLTTSNHLSTLTGGTATLKNNYASSGSAHKMVGKDNDERHLRFKQNDHLLIVTFENALAEGDIISFTGYGSNQLSFTTTETRATTPATSSKSYTIPSASGLIGATTIYIWRSSGSDTYIKSLTVTRPCDESAETCKTPNITNIASTTNMTTAETKSLNVTLGNPDALTGTVSYAWTNSDGTAIDAAATKATGTTTARLTLTEPAAGTYTFMCTVTNDCGGDGSQSATSAVFTVVVTASTGCTEIAKVIVSGTSTGTDSGTKIAETGGYGVKLENTTASHGGNTGYKIGSGNYVYLQLASGEQFQNGDKVKVYITHLSDQGDNKLHIFQGTTAAGTEVATVNSPALGWNEATLSNVTTGNRSLTIHRSSGTTEQNHYIYAFAVERCVDCTPATHEGLAYTKTSYTVGETAEELTVTNPENVDTYQWKWNTTGDRTSGSNCGTNAATFTPPTTSAGTRYYWCELTNDCGTVKTSAVGITVSADLSDVTVTWTDPAGTVNYGGGGYTIKATVDPAAWDGTLDASMLTVPEGIRIYDVEINNTEHTLQAKFDVQTTFDREANATDIPFALTLAATANYDGITSNHNVAYSACAAGGGGEILFSQNFNSATEVAYTNGTSTAITTSSGNNIVGNTAASQFTYIGIVNKSSTGIAINTESGGNSQDITGAFQAYANNTTGKYALVKTTNFAATAPTALRIEADVWFHTLNSTTDYSLSFAVGESFSDGTGGASASNVHSGFSFYNASAVYLYAYRNKSTKISGTNQFTQSKFQKLTWVINNTGDDLEYTNPAGTKSTLENDKFDVWVGTTQFVSGQAATTPAKALQNLYIGDPNGKGHEFRLDNVTVTDISTSSGTGSLTTALTWSNSQADGATLAKDEGTADFAVTANRDAAATTSLGALTYSSSDASVATVNETTGQVHIADNIDFGGATYKETTIEATLAASGCYKRAHITYILRVNARPCEDVAGTVTPTTVGCTTTLALSGYTAGATIQWYKDGEAIPSATSATYAATASGEYYAVTTKNCDRTSNTVAIASTAVSATKIVDEWYVKNGRRTPDIALVQTTNATGFTVTSGGSPITSIGGCEFYRGTDGIIYLKGAQNDGSDPSGMTEGDDVLSITATGCSDAAPVSVTIHRQVETDKYVLAYVVTGKQDGGWTQDLPADQTTGVELYRTLTNHFDLQATNIYATTDEQKIKEYYSRYDIIFITDYPNTKTKNKTTKKSYVDALGAMIDIRPILTMEAWVSGLTNWSEKGVEGSPKSPTTRQYNMLLQCKDHEIFSSTTVETIGDGDDVKFKINMVDSTQALYDTLDTKYGAGAHAETTGYRYGKHPALQGFVYDEALADMLPLGLIDDGAGNDLQVGLERQKEMEARMMVLGINADAMERLSDDGETVIVNALKYLMKKDAEDISDCSIYFDNAGGDHLWSTVANWGPSHLTLPQPTQEARILQPCIVQGEANAASIKIISGGKYNHGTTDANGSLTIAKSGILKVGGRIVAASAPNYYEVRPTDASRLIIQADKVQTGALIHGHKSGELNATVQLVSKSYSERVTEDGKTKKKKYWQYIGLPVQSALAEDAFYGAYTYKYNEPSGWEKKGTGTTLEEFWGIGLSVDNLALGISSPVTFNISGALALATDRDIELTKTAEAGNGENMIGNSWTAPIHLVNMTDDDFENATATIYLFNTGRNDSHTNSAYGSTTAGQWISIPVGATKLDPWQGPSVIPAMQAFEVDVAGGATSGTLHLNYDKHVRNIGTGPEENAALNAPKRYQSDEPSMMRLRVADTATYTDLYLIEGEEFSDEFDNGYDGKYQQCDGRSATLYALSPIGNMAVLAQQSINNTAIVFRPGRQNEYTFTFGYNGEVAYYLNDLLLEQSTEIREGNEYRFTCNEGDMESRFVVSTTPFGAPDITTGIGNAGHPEKVQKIMYKDHIYIIRAGRVYDIVGKEVR